MVGVEQENGTILVIYNHFDGYVEGVGSTLQESYNSLERANALVAMGDASLIGATLEASPAVSDFGFSFQFEDEFRKLPKVEQSLYVNDHYSGQYSLFYGRDRGETGTEATLYRNFAQWKSSENFDNYNYLFHDGEWWLLNSTTHEPRKLEEVLNQYV